MKRTISMIALLAVCFCLIGCSTARTVPDTYLEWEIEDYFDSLDLSPDNMPTTKRTIKHSPDAETGTDTATIELKMTFPYNVAVAKYECVYKYDKASEVWTKLRGKEWYDYKVISYDLPTSPEFWAAKARKYFDRVQYQVSDRDDLFDPEDQPDLYAAVEGAWAINGGGNGLNMLFFEFSKGKSAYDLFSKNADVFLPEDFYHFDFGKPSGEGENYTYDIINNFHSIYYLMFIENRMYAFNFDHMLDSRAGSFFNEMGLSFFIIY